MKNYKNRKVKILGSTLFNELFQLETMLANLIEKVIFAQVI